MIFVVIYDGRNVKLDNMVKKGLPMTACPQYVVMIMVINRECVHTNRVWDLFLAFSSQCVTAQASVSAVKCDLKWPRPPLSQWGGK